MNEKNTPSAFEEYNILDGNEKGASHFGQKRGHSGKMVKNRNRVKELNHYDH